jgi:Protein of unknown function (DUF3800)
MGISVLERLNKFIERENDLLLKKKQSHEFGIMIIDSQGMEQDQTLRKSLFWTLRQGTLYVQLKFLIEDPLFTDSKWRNLSQLSDCIAYCIRKYYRKNTQSMHTSYWESYYKKLQSKLYAPFGTYIGYGLKIFP